MFYMVTTIERENMNFKRIVLAIVICGIQQIQGMSDQSILFSRAQELFSKQQYQDAFNVYQRMTDKEFVVLYNMSLCCLRQNKKTEALLFLKRAEKKAESYKELTLVQELIELNEYEELQDKNWYKQLAIFCKKSILATPILLFQALILIALIFLIICWHRQWYKKYFGSSILLLIVWLLLYSMWLYKIDYIQKKYAVVFQEEVPVFAGPHSSFNKKTDLHESQVVTVIDRRDDYFKIKLDNLIGWIDSYTVELV